MQANVTNVLYNYVKSLNHYHSATLNHRGFCCINDKLIQTTTQQRNASDTLTQVILMYSVLFCFTENTSLKENINQSKYFINVIIKEISQTVLTPYSLSQYFLNIILMNYFLHFVKPI